MRHQPVFDPCALASKRARPFTTLILLTLVANGHPSRWPFFLLCLWLLAGCQPQPVAMITAEPVTAVAPANPFLGSVLVTALPVSPTMTATAAAVIARPASPTPIPTITPTATAPATNTPTVTPTPTLTPTATPIGPCSRRVPPDDLLTLVTRQYALSRDYEPADLVPLADYFPPDVTLGFPNSVRQVIIPSLQQLIADMQAAGLAPTLISGYRSYAAQSIAWTKWLDREGDRGALLSAPPGRSEHQLGTTVDFGSPELENEFHTYFYKTGEGLWLAEHAHKYGFSLSYPRRALDLTGFYYEPWHFRYIGVEMATYLKEVDMFLTEYQLLTQPQPCVPDNNG
jgi:zinc D-Ala-D-Ala carboxypeptidase